MKIIHKFSLNVCSLAILLTGCGSELSVREVCQDTPQFCDDLNKDSWCNAPRAEVILGRYLETQTPTDDLRFKLISDLEEYSTCVELASHIEHIKLKEKKTSRVNGYMTSLRELDRLAKITKDSDHPHLLYWHWSRHGSEDSMTRFLALRDKGELETPELQFKLATYFIKYDANKTINTLYHALELYRQDDEINPEILKALNTIYLKKEKFKHAYVWGKIARDLGLKDIDLAALKAVLMNQNMSINKLDALANSYKDSIEGGQFIPPNR